jgi:MarR family transcriptional repressor of emrRAB
VADPRTTNLLGAFVLTASDRLRTASEGAAGSGGSTPAALTLLGTVEGRTIDWLAHALGVSHSATVRLVDRLESEGLVRRGPGPDRRSVTVRLTSAGRRASQRVLQARMGAMDALLEVLDETQQQRLAELLEALLTGMLTSDSDVWRICRMCHVQACLEPFCPVLESVRVLRRAPD